MATRTPWGTAIIFALAMSSYACGAASQKILGQPVKKPVAIVVRISQQVNIADEAGGVAELVEAVENGLKKQGLTSEVYTSSDDHPPPPRIELNVVYWSERSSTSRQLGAAAAIVPLVGLAGALTGPSNRMVVDCAVFLDETKRAFWQRFDVRAGLSFGDPDEALAGSDAGALIVREILK